MAAPMQPLAPPLTVCALLAAGTRLPGSETAVAEGNSLGKGPSLFHLPQPVLQLVTQRARQGDPGASLLRAQLLRLAAAFVVESCEAGACREAAWPARLSGPVIAVARRHLLRCSLRTHVPCPTQMWARRCVPTCSGWRPRMALCSPCSASPLPPPTAWPRPSPRRLAT